MGECNVGDEACHADPDAAKRLGYDLDGVYSSKGETNHCQPVEGGSKETIRLDGDGGIDNSFGRNVVPLLEGFVASPSLAASDAIAKGVATLLLKLDNLGVASSQNGLSGELFACEGSLDAAGGFVPVGDADWGTGLYAWHPLPALLEQGGSSKTKLAGAYVVDDVFVSNGKGLVTFVLPLSGYHLELPIAQARFEIALDEGRKAGRANLGGLIETARFLYAFERFMGRWSTSLCDEAVAKGLIAQIGQASDIMLDGTQDPTLVCDAISIGIGFDVASGSLGDPAPVRDDQADPCAP